MFKKMEQKFRMKEASTVTLITVVVPVCTRAEFGRISLNLICFFKTDVHVLMQETILATANYKTFIKMSIQLPSQKINHPIQECSHSSGGRTL